MYIGHVKQVSENKNCAKVDCGNCVESNQHLFKGIPSHSIDELNRSKITHYYKRGDVIFSAGDEPLGLTCISQGIVRVETLSDEGQTSFVRLAKPGEVLGHLALFAKKPLHVSAVAHEDATVCLIPKEVFMKVSLENPQLMLEIASRLSVELREAELKIESITHKEATERVIEAVIHFREKYPEQKWTRKEIADWAGTTPETVMRVLGKAEDQGHIEQTGRTIKIVDRNKFLKSAKH